MKKSELKKKKLGEVLLSVGLITKPQLEEALAMQRKTHRRLGHIFTELGHVDEMTLCKTLSKQLNIPLIDITTIEPDDRALACVHEETAREKVVLPIRIVDGDLTLAMSNPLDWMTAQEVEFAGGFKVYPTIAPESEILKAIERVYGMSDSAMDATAGLPEEAEVDINKIAVEGFGNDIDSLYRAADFPPVVQGFSKFLIEAIEAGATDIHLEPREKHVQVRMRVEGNLRNTLRYPNRAHEALVARAKTLARLDLANRTMPQEGSNRIAIGSKEISIRVSTLPSINGEAVLISIADRKKAVTDIGRLGLPAEVRMQVSALLHKRQGLLLIAGLKGSGRHGTLYSLLKFLESDSQSIIGIGTSSGYRVDGIKEVRLNEAAGFNMPNAIRSALRHDPDIIATGQLKNKESTEAAIGAAMNGKLVLSLIDAPDAASALDLLTSFGISPYKIRAAVSGAMAQKLMHGICTTCRDKLDTKKLATALRDLPPIKSAFTGLGCAKCGNTGNKGRVAVYEFVGMSNNLITALSCEITRESIRQAADTSGFNTMFEDAWAKAASGLITIDEALTLRPQNL